MINLTEYIKRLGKEFEVIYYPGSGLDFSPLSLFANFSNDTIIYFSDYMKMHELEKVIHDLDSKLDNWEPIRPKFFNKSSWDDFWPTNPLAWNEEFHHPKHAWGRKYQFTWEDKNCTFYYLGTEGVQTAAILLENNIIPDVLVLQDHGGCTNYDLFSGLGSPLYQVMKKHLPKYILMDPTGEEDTVLWPNYVQITKSYQPPIFLSLPQNQRPRALFKRI